MPKPSSVNLEIMARLRVASGVPSEIFLSLVENKAGMLIVSAEQLGGPFRGDFDTVKNLLAMAVARKRARSGDAGEPSPK